MNTYKKWKSITETDFVTLFIKTWFAYISTLREMFPEAYNRIGDKKYLNSYKEFYIKEGYKRLEIDDVIMKEIENVYKEGKNIILTNYPEYYFWDFYKINDSLNYLYKNIDPDDKNGTVINMKINKKRMTKNKYTLFGFISFWVTIRNKGYNELIKFSVKLTDIIEEMEQIIKKDNLISERQYLNILIEKIKKDIFNQVQMEYNDKLQEFSDKKLLSQKYKENLLLVSAEIRKIFNINIKNDIEKDDIEIMKEENDFCIIKQRPNNYFIEDRELPIIPIDKDINSKIEKKYKSLIRQKRKDSIIWFLDFVYRLRNALFHEIIDPFDEEWQIIFKNSYLLLKELVDININYLEGENK